MRLLFVILSLCQCASSPGETRGRAIVIVGLAEAPDHVEPRYTMLWRKIDADGAQFGPHGGRRVIEFSTHTTDTVRAPGLPGEFAVAEVEPGHYALDGVYASLREGAVTFTAQGSTIGPERPGFQARAGR